MAEMGIVTEPKSGAPRNDRAKNDRRGIALIIGALLIAILIGAWVLFKLAVPSPYPLPGGEGVLTRGELRQVLLGARGNVPLQGNVPVQAADLATAAGCPGPAVYDTYGTLQDLSWLESTYGPVSWQCAEVHPDAGYIYRLTELRASCGPAVIVANVKDENGGPLADRAVIRYWPGAPALPYYEPPASRWTDYGVVGWTSSNGDVGFGLGTGDYYWPQDGAGASKLYVADYDGPADMVEGLGMIAATDHCTLFPVWHRIPKEDVIPPTATPSPPAPLPEGEGWYKLEGVWIQLATPEP